MATAVLLSLHAGPAKAQAITPAPDCELAASAAEQRHDLPTGLLDAIGRVESGLRDPASGIVRPWPWTINAIGAGVVLPTRDAAVAAVAALQRQGVRSIDVGCFQVNLGHHPDAFNSLSDAFDPMANADYAARFLAGLHRRTGNWEDAVMAYHSATPAHGIPYRDHVLQVWAHAPEQEVPRVWPGVPAAGIGVCSVQVWTPARPGTAPREIRLARSTPAMPTVITVSHEAVTAAGGHVNLPLANLRKNDTRAGNV